VTQYLVIYEQCEGSWSAHSPDVPGCIAAGDSREEVALLMAEGIELHLDLLRREGLAIPTPSCTAGFVAA
jgi:predicted RNase H-like HicB family nuclease